MKKFQIPQFTASRHWKRAKKNSQAPPHYNKKLHQRGSGGQKSVIINHSTSAQKKASHVSSHWRGIWPSPLCARTALRPPKVAAVPLGGARALHLVHPIPRALRQQAWPPPSSRKQPAEWVSRQRQRDSLAHSVGPSTCYVTRTPIACMTPVTSRGHVANQNNTSKQSWLPSGSAGSVAARLLALVRRRRGCCRKIMIQINWTEKERRQAGRWILR